VDIRRRVYAAIRGTRLSRLEIVYVLARPDTSLSYKASDFVDGTLQGKPVNQAALADQLVNVDNNDKNDLLRVIYS
jgi:hypothetical protein